MSSRSPPADLITMTHHGGHRRDRVPPRAAAPGRAVGAKAVLRALRDLPPGVRPTVLVALDAPVSLVRPVRERAAALSLRVIDVGTATELGARFRVTRPVATALETAQPEDIAQDSA
ncbi:MAG TPA: hypothetical protein VNB94_06690 [Mycobacteriales bacterium]|nr:hypothetical protein [Mycobacteriales bacterium]